MAVQPLHRTLPGRAIVVGVAIKLAVLAVRLAGAGVPAFVGVIDTVAGVAIAAGAVYFLIELFLLAKRRLLWRVRRKLILSYIFIGFVPAILIAVFFVLGALLLLFNFSSYLLQAEVRSLDDRARLAATSAALEIQRDGARDARGTLSRLQSGLQAEFPGVSLAVVPAARACTRGNSQLSSLNSQVSSSTSELKVESAELVSGPWTHVDVPASVPAWIGCEGFAGLLAASHRERSGDVTEMFVRGVGFPDSSMPGYAVIVDLPDITDRLRRNTGVDLRSVAAVDVAGRAAKPIEARAGEAPEPRDGGANLPARRLSWVTFLDYHDWNSGEPGTLLVNTQLNIQDIYGRISAAQGVVGDRPFGQALLLVLLVVVGGLFFVIEVVALVVGSALARSITGSVHELFTGTERVRQGDFSHKIAITAKDQLGELAGSFNDMTASIEDLLRQKEEKKRLEEELRIAHEIQMSLLPQGPLAMPGLSATALCIPAREVGGDYYDFLPLDDHRVGVLIADVSGKGTSAALYMAQLKGLVLSLSRIHASPRDLLVAANRIIARHLDARSFITMTYAIVDLRARTMTYARAGHTPLIHVPGGGITTINAETAEHAEKIGSAGSASSALNVVSRPRRARILAPSGLVVGLKLDDGEMFDRLLEEQEIPLQAGDLYVFFTDGISEAMNSADDCFGELRLGQLVEDHADLPSEELRERVLREVRAFVDGAPQHDDMTMILLKVEEAQISTTEDTEERRIKSVLTSVSSVSSVVER
jgi:sigma-B regulation protein RsbU (phosphoserine phosphatase)